MWQQFLLSKILVSDTSSHETSVVSAITFMVNLKLLTW